jgi:hypothetical protein
MPVQRRARVQARVVPRETLPRWRAELPFAILSAAALAAPLCVLDQGGSLHAALLAGLAVLAVPGAAIEAMAAVARLAAMPRRERD